MRNKIIIITAFWIILLTNISLTSVFAEPVIEQILFDSPAANLDQLTLVMNGAYTPKTFTLNGDKPRVVFDFPDAVPGKKVQNTMQTDGTFIKSIRTGIHKGDNPKTRIVLDLQPGMKIDFAQDFNSETNTLEIRIFAAGMPPEKNVTTGEKPGPAMEKIVQAAPLPVDQEAPGKKEQAEPPEEIKDKRTGVKETGQPEPVRESAETDIRRTAPPPETKPMKPGAETQPQKEMTGTETADMPDVPPAGPETFQEQELEESTVIQPLSEIGEKEKAAKDDHAVPILYSVDFDNTSHRGEIVSFKLNGFNPPVVFGIEEDIPRIVCFFKDTGAGEGLAESIESNGKFIKNIKIAVYRNPENVRVVLDLVPGKNYDLQQIFFKEDNLFMVIINTAGDKTAD